MSDAAHRAHRRPLRLGARPRQERAAARRPPAARVRDRTAQQAESFDRVVVSTDSEAIADVARWYGADVPFLRPPEYATATSPDIEWIADLLGRLHERYDLFAIVRATNPFRGPDAIRRGLEQLLATPEADSVRAVELVKQHPGKMWIARRGRPDDAPASRPVAPRRRLARRPVPGAAARLRPEQRARDRVDAGRDGDRHARGPRAGAVPHRGLRRASTSTTRTTGSGRSGWWHRERLRCPRSAATRTRA